MEGSVLRGTKK